MKTISNKGLNSQKPGGYLGLMVAALVCMTLLAACGDTPATGSAGENNSTANNKVVLGPKIEPCSLVTQAEFDSIWGIQTTLVKEEGSISEGYDSSCDYDSQHLLVSLFVNRAGKVSAVTNRDNSAAFDALRKYSEHTDIPDLGDKAMWDPRFEQLMVVKHNVMLMVNISEGKIDRTEAGKAARQAKSIALAQKAVTRIP